MFPIVLLQFIGFAIAGLATLGCIFIFVVIIVLISKHSSRLYCVGNQCPKCDYFLEGDYYKSGQYYDCPECGTPVKKM